MLVLPTEEGTTDEEEAAPGVIANEGLVDKGGTAGFCGTGPVAFALACALFIGTGVLLRIFRRDAF